MDKKLGRNLIKGRLSRENNDENGKKTQALGHLPVVLRLCKKISRHLDNNIGKLNPKNKLRIPIEPCRCNLF